MAESVTIQQARRHFESLPSVVTLRRWAREGVLGRSGQRVKLETFRDGGRVYVRLDAIQVFKVRLNSKQEILRIDA
jgi:hypothetical protein